ncbi:hypothetical protein CRENPOLYSF1_890028 [Crenothrix polyspora]|uniref:Uncharacterized protein n=1 Tax=Crenothrix polyspora TaxID=360316 RepID=A0A1R4HJF0_9GAMM|nr:hypothetical protein CRENPOLYSF1_890028 [Crenothrix polyspora]
MADDTLFRVFVFSMDNLPPKNETFLNILCLLEYASTMR